MDRFDDDEYVARLLATEAATTSSTYQLRGLPALLPPRSTAAPPKPNTRFLRNIVRDVDFHNTALLAKEAAEANARLRRLQRQRSPDKETQRRRHKEEGRLTRSPEPEKARRHRRDDDDRTHKKSRHDHSASPERHHRRRSRRDRSASPDRTHRRKRSRSPHRRHHHRHRREDDHHRDKRKRSTSMSTAVDPPTTATVDTKTNPSPSSPDSFSDPLEDLIGPAPPPRARGRGATGTAAMDSRFQPGYNPTDEGESGGDGFEDALEAYRDRQKWKQQGAERLRSAGMGEDFVRAWENRDLKDEAKLKWAEKGGTREWDRGKVEGEMGVDLRADWVKKSRGV